MSAVDEEVDHAEIDTLDNADTNDQDQESFEIIDGSPTQEEQEQKGLLEQPLEVDGKRRRSAVVRMTPVTPTPKGNVYKGGNGVALGSIDFIAHQLTKHGAPDLKTLHRLLYGVPGKATTLKKDIRAFTGFDFKEKTPEFEKRQALAYRLTLNELKLMKNVLGIQLHGHQTKDTIVNNLMCFLYLPTDNNRKVPQKKKKTSEKSVRRNKKAKKEKDVGTSKEEVEESSGGSDPGSNDDDSDEEEEKEAKKKRVVKRKVVAEEEEDEVKSEPKPKKVAKKKADNSKDVDKIPESSDSSVSDDDEPAKEDEKKPSDTELEETIKKLLKTFDLSEVTMKQMCQAVMNEFPGSDLADRKTYLRDKIKNILTSLH